LKGSNVITGCKQNRHIDVDIHGALKAGFTASTHVRQKALLLA